MFVLSFQSAARRARTVEQMLHDQLSRLLRRELRHGQYRLQQFAYIGHREGGQDLDLQLAGQLWVARILLTPVRALSL